MGVYRRGFKPMFQNSQWKILRGDKVVVTSGKDKGQVGKVTKVFRDEKWPRVVVEGLNLTKRHVKATSEHPAGNIQVESPIHYSNVALIDPITNQPVRVEWRYLADGTRVRESRGKLSSRSVIPKPPPPPRSPRRVAKGPLDTPLDVIAKPTHVVGSLPSLLEKLRINPSKGRGITGIRPSFAASAIEGA